jgi:hypothetical protein
LTWKSGKIRISAGFKKLSCSSVAASHWEGVDLQPPGVEVGIYI